MPKLIGILDFAYRLGFTTLYDWQCRCLLRYESCDRVAAACANNTGKTSTLFPIAALWVLHNFPRSRVMYVTASGDQLRHQFFSYLRKYADCPMFKGWSWLDCETRTPMGGFLFGRSTDSGGRIEGLHDEVDSPAGILVDECKSVQSEIADTLLRCNAMFRLYASSTGPASGWFFDLMTAEDDRTKRFTVSSDMCTHVKREDIEKDREELKPNVFAIKHEAAFLYDSGTSMISLEHVRGLLRAQKEVARETDVVAQSKTVRTPAEIEQETYKRMFIDPPRLDPNEESENNLKTESFSALYEGSVPIIAGTLWAFCDFAGGGDFNALALFDGNVGWIEDDWREKDTMASVGRFIGHFKRLGLSGWQIGGDQGFGGALMDRMAEQGWHLKRVRNGDPAKAKKDFFNADAERWSLVGKLIENKQIIIRDRDPERLERLVKQLTSRQKIYDSDGRERLEPKDKLKSRTGWSPDLADAFVGACMLGPGSQPYAANPGLAKQELEAMQEVGRAMERHRNPFAVGHVDFSGM
jgi:hypothetical protein